MTKRNLRIIIIDDNNAIHNDFRKILTKKSLTDDQHLSRLEEGIFGSAAETSLLPNFEIDSASQGQEGVEKIAQAIKEGNAYAVAFVDVRMPPGWDGIETIQHIWKLDDQIQVVICTAYSDYSWEDTVQQLGDRDNLLFLKKPFDSTAVRQLAAALTRKWQLLHDTKVYTDELEAKVRERTASLNESLSMIRATFDSSEDGILVVDMQNKIIDYNKKMLTLFPLPKSFAKQASFDLFLEFVEVQAVENSLSKDLEKLVIDPAETLIGKLKFKDGKQFEYYSQRYFISTNILGRVWNFHDITQRTLLESTLQFQATHDALTGVANRRLLFNQMVEQIEHAADEKFGILFLDLDRFKLINDSLSHQAGDDLLVAIGERLQAVIDSNHLLARIGGDEFIVLANHIQSKAVLGKLASLVLSVFNKPFYLERQEITMTTSIGIAIYPDDGQTPETLIRNADSAMHYSKELGTNQYQFYSDDLNIKNLKRLEQESELRRAIANEEFFLTYQPQFSTVDKKLVAVEALIRWQHPKKGLILPSDFIPLAEETGLIVLIGEWVLRNACTQVKTWHEQGLAKIRVAVNITTKQFRVSNLVQRIKAILDEIKLEPRYLELELTENIIINNLDMVRRIAELKAMGIQIALDDFGTGYSSLNYLREIPIDRIKIDQSYVKNIDSNRGDDAIIQAIIAMAKSMHLDVLAEGVETERQLQFLQAQNCGEVQGFYFSKPISAQECEALLVLMRDGKKQNS